MPHEKPDPAIFCSPTRYTQGPRATEILGSEMKTVGLEGPVLVIAGRSAARILGDTWKATFEEEGFAYSILEFGGECSQQEITRGIARAWDSTIRFGQNSDSAHSARSGRPA